MRSRPVRSLADRVAALEDQIVDLASSLEDVSDGDDHGDGGTPERDPADPPPKLMVRPVRAIGVSHRADLPEFVMLEIVDYAGKRTHYPVRQSDLALVLPFGTQAFAPTPANSPSVDPDEELTRARARLTNAEAELKERELQTRALVPPRKGYLRADKLTVGFDEDRGVPTLAVTALDYHSELAIGIDPSRIPWLIEKLAWAMGQAKSDER